MKRLLLAVLVVAAGMAGCLRGGGLNIVQVIDSRSLNPARGAGTLMRERYIGTYPYSGRIMVLAAEDNAGNIIETDVDWAMEDPSLGTLTEYEPSRPAIKILTPAKTGESQITASNAEESDTARIVVYPGTIRPIGGTRGFIFASQTWTWQEGLSDIWWPESGGIRFTCGYWTDTSILAHLETMDELTAEGKTIIPGPVNYTYHTDTEQLFLVQAQDGALYACIATGGKLIYKPTPVIPAP